MDPPRFGFALDFETSKMCTFNSQEGACPLKKEDGRNFPFTATSKYDSVTARLHFMVGNLSRVDVRLSTADKKIYCNWFCKDNDFILRAHRMPLYGPFYFPMFFEIMKGWAHIGRQITSVADDDKNDDIMQKQMHM